MEEWLISKLHMFTDFPLWLISFKSLDVFVEQRVVRKWRHSLKDTVPFDYVRSVVTESLTGANLIKVYDAYLGA